MCKHHALQSTRHISSFTNVKFSHHKINLLYKNNIYKQFLRNSVCFIECICVFMWVKCDIADYTVTERKKKYQSYYLTFLKNHLRMHWLFKCCNTPVFGWYTYIFFFILKIYRKIYIILFIVLPIAVYSIVMKAFSARIYGTFVNTHFV